MVDVSGAVFAACTECLFCFGLLVTKYTVWLVEVVVVVVVVGRAHVHPCASCQRVRSVHVVVLGACTLQPSE